MYVHEVLVNRLSQERNVVRESDPPAMTKAVDWDVKQQNKHTNKQKASEDRLHRVHPSELEWLKHHLIDVDACQHL